MPGTVDPGHGVVVLFGPGTAISGLTPPLSISVAPSGIVPPFRFDPLIVGVDSGEAVPAVDKLDDAAVQPVETVEPAALNPPPSNVELPLVPAIPDTEVPVGEQPPFAAGLKPPGSISVAPNGMPVPLDALEPSGDVLPIAEVLVGLWPYAMPQFNEITIRKSKRNLFKPLLQKPFWIGLARSAGTMTRSFIVLAFISYARLPMMPPSKRYAVRTEARLNYP